MSTKSYNSLAAFTNSHGARPLIDSRQLGSQYFSSEYIQNIDSNSSDFTCRICLSETCNEADPFISPCK
jgi:hypothetical protein